MRLVVHLFSRLCVEVERSTGLCLFLLFVSAVIGFVPAALFLPFGHDAMSHLAFNAEFLEVIRAGILYPRWLPDMNQGDGSPEFIFTYPLFSFVTAAVSWNVGVIPGLQIATFLFWCGSAMAMFTCARVWLSRSASLASALTYLFLPYHTYDLYERAALPELAQFFWLPLISLCLARLQRGVVRPVAAMALCLTGAVLTHSVTAGIVLYLLAAVGILGLFRSTSFSAKIFAAMILALMLSAIYLLPALWETRFINFFLENGPSNYQTNFLFSPANDANRQNVLAWASVQTVLLTSLLSVFGLTRVDKYYNRKETPERIQELSELKRSSLVVGVVTVFMMLPISAPIWQLPGLRHLEFPWRWLLVGSFAASFLVGLQWYPLVHHRGKWRIVALSIVAANLCLATVPWANQVAYGLRRGAWLWSADFVAENKYRGDAAFPPIWVPNAEYRFLTSSKAQSNPPEIDPEVVILGGSGKSEVIEWSPSERQVELDMQAPASLVIRTFYYPGWECTIDGSSVPIGVSSEGRILLAVTAANHQLSCSFRDTPIRTAGSIISLTSLLGTVAMVLFDLRRERTGRHSSLVPIRSEPNAAPRLEHSIEIFSKFHR